MLAAGSVQSGRCQCIRDSPPVADLLIASQQCGVSRELCCTQDAKLEDRDLTAPGSTSEKRMGPASPLTHPRRSCGQFFRPVPELRATMAGMPPDRDAPPAESFGGSSQEPRRVPRVSIGMPVYNGARYLEEAVHSLLRQTERDFTLLISDNSSTDETPRICARLVGADPRVTYVRQAVNIGVVRNFNYVFEAAQSPYFMWAAHDDLWAPEFLARCLGLLEDDPEAVAAFSSIRRIGPNAEIVEPFVALPAGVSSRHVTVRVGAFFRCATWSHTYGVGRLEALRSTGGFVTRWGSDGHLLLTLALKGPTAIAPEVLFSARRYPHKAHEDYAEMVPVELAEHPTQQLLWDLVRETWEAPLPTASRVGGLALGIPALYKVDAPWRRDLLAELADDMREAKNQRRWARLAGRSLVRTALDPRTVVRVLQTTRHRPT